MNPIDHSIPPTERPGDDLLDRYCLGLASREDLAELEAWRVAHPHPAARLERLRDMLAKPAVELTPAGIETGVETVRNATRAELPVITKPKRRTRGNRLWVAASAVIVTVVAYLGITKAPPGTPTTDGQTYTTIVGQRSTIRLPDGTEVILAPRTSLVLDPGYGTTHRRMSLDGQAHFAVTSDAGLPFIVKSGRVTTRVLGTEFTIRHYTGDPDVAIAVRSGKVMSGSTRQIVLSNNTLARFTDTSEVVTKNVDLQEYLEWTHGRLVFTRAPASEITSVIGQWYGLTFQFADSTLQRQHLTGVVDHRDTRSDVLQYLQTMLDAQLTFEGNIVVIRKQTTALQRLHLERRNSHMTFQKSVEP